MVVVMVEEGNKTHLSGKTWLGATVRTNGDPSISSPILFV